MWEQASAPIYLLVNIRALLLATYFLRVIQTGQAREASVVVSSAKRGVMRQIWKFVPRSVDS